MIETRTIMRPVEAKCEVLFYIHGTPICWDPHFAPDPEFDYKENGAIRYFDTREEAEKTMEEIYKDAMFLKTEVREKVIPLNYFEKEVI